MPKKPYRHLTRDFANVETGSCAILLVHPYAALGGSMHDFVIVTVLRYPCSRSRRKPYGAHFSSMSLTANLQTHKSPSAKIFTFSSASRCPLENANSSSASLIRLKSITHTFATWYLPISMSTGGKKSFALLLMRSKCGGSFLKTTFQGYSAFLRK